jgi:hypothetical protein
MGENRVKKRHTESLDNALLVVVVPTAGLASLQQALQHDLFGGVNEEDE